MVNIPYVKLSIISVFSLMLSLAALLPANAASYDGTTVSPESDGKTYNVVAGTGDSVTLENAGGEGNELVITFENAVDGTIVVEAVDSRPSDVNDNPPGSVNVYFDVTLNSITNDDIKSSAWTFSISKSWLDSNGLTSENIFVYHWNGSSWDQLTTRETASDSTSHTFKAEVPSFSEFAVTGVEGLSNTGSPYLVGALFSIGVLATLGVSFRQSRKTTT